MSRLSTPKNLLRCLTDSAHQVGVYYQQAQQITQLNHLWKTQSDLPLALHSDMVHYEADRLVLAIENAEWATHFYYAKFSLIKRLKQWSWLSQLTDIVGQVRQSEVAKMPLTQVIYPPHLSQSTKALLHNVANTLPHSALQSALRTLADHEIG